MKKEKWMSHIIAAVALAASLVLCFSCGSIPGGSSGPTEIVYDQSIPSDQLATLYIPPGSIEVIEFNGVALNPKWYQASIRSPGMNVKIPAGNHNIRFHYYGGEYGVRMRNVNLDINIVAGRTYKLIYLLTDYSRSYFTGRISETVLFTVLETSEKREPGPDEQVLSITSNRSFVLVVLNEGKDNERIISLGIRTEGLRLIIEKGEYTIGIFPHPGSGLARLEPTGEQERFIVSSEPIRYSIEVGNVTGRDPNIRATYTLTRQ